MQYITRDNMFRRCESDSGGVLDQPIVPTRYRETVMELAHDTIMSGHQGVKSTIARVFNHFFGQGCKEMSSAMCDLVMSALIESAI